MKNKKKRYMIDARKLEILTRAQPTYGFTISKDLTWFCDGCGNRHKDLDKFKHQKFCAYDRHFQAIKLIQEALDQ